MTHSQSSATKISPDNPACGFWQRERAECPRCESGDPERTSDFALCTPCAFRLFGDEGLHYFSAETKKEN